MNTEFLSRNEAVIVKAACQIAVNTASGGSLFDEQITPEQRQENAIAGVKLLMAALESLSPAFEPPQASGQVSEPV